MKTIITDNNSERITVITDPDRLTHLPAIAYNSLYLVQANALAEITLGGLAEPGNIVGMYKTKT